MTDDLIPTISPLEQMQPNDPIHIPALRATLLQENRLSGETNVPRFPILERLECRYRSRLPFFFFLCINSRFSLIGKNKKKEKYRK